MNSQVEQQEWERRIERLERDAVRFQQEAEILRTQWEQIRQSHSEASQMFDGLREAVLRYAVACAATEVQAAMLRARGDSTDIAENLRRCVEEQNEASNALRMLARQLHPSRSTSDLTERSGI